MRNHNKLLKIMQRSMDYNRKNLGTKVMQDVEDIIKKLKEQNLSKKELDALRTSYEALYQDSMGSLGAIVALFSLYLGTNIVQLLPIIDAIRNVVQGILIIAGLFCMYSVVNKVVKENIIYRNHIIAVSALIAEIE